MKNPRDVTTIKNLGEAFRYFKPIRARIAADACVDPLGRNPNAAEQSYDAWKARRDGDQGEAAAQL